MKGRGESLRGRRVEDQLSRGMEISRERERRYFILKLSSGSRGKQGLEDGRTKVTAQSDLAGGAVKRWPALFSSSRPQTRLRWST